MSEPARETIDTLRASIDRIDAALVELLAERFAVTERIGLLKREAGLPPRDADRERRMAERLAARAREAGLSGDVLDRVYEVIVTEVRRRHARLRDGG